jgi:hypothetical protein
VWLPVLYRLGYRGRPCKRFLAAAIIYIKIIQIWIHKLSILGEGAGKYSVLGHTALATALHSPNITQTIQLFNIVF